MMTEDIKACPNCGSYAIDKEGWKSATGRGPECFDCGTTSRSIEQWNKRASLWISFKDSDPEPDEMFLFKAPGIDDPELVYVTACLDTGELWCPGLEQYVNELEECFWMAIPNNPEVK